MNRKTWAIYIYIIYIPSPHIISTWYMDHRPFSGSFSPYGRTSQVRERSIITGACAPLCASAFVGCLAAYKVLNASQLANAQKRTKHAGKQNMLASRHICCLVIDRLTGKTIAYVCVCSLKYTDR